MPDTHHTNAATRLAREVLRHDPAERLLREWQTAEHVTLERDQLGGLYVTDPAHKVRLYVDADTLGHWHTADALHVILNRLTRGLAVARTRTPT